MTRSPRPLLAGVDAGGTSIDAGVGVSPAHILATTSTSSVRLTADTIDDVARAISATLDDAVASAAHGTDLDALIVGAAGAADRRRAQALRAALASLVPAQRIAVVTDVELVLADAFPDSQGIAMIAGTGSIAAAQTPDGNLLRAGGGGVETGDPGSAYALGLGAIRHATAPRADSTLHRQVREHCRIVDATDLERWAAAASPAAVAALAPLVLGAAQRGDPDALRLVQAALADLIDLVDAVRTQLGGSEVIPVALWGGLFRNDWLKHEVEEQIALRPDLALLQAPVDPVRGALRLAVMASA